MQESAPSATDRQQKLAAFYERADPHGLSPLWLALARLVPAQPESPARASIWRYDEVRPFLIEASSLIGTEEAERRVLMLENAGMPGEAKITRSLYAGLQIIQPGEYARRHRHTAAALRFVMEGTGGWTSVDGERTYMEPGDFVVTPSWTWHEHGNEGSGPVVWMDGLDVHIVNLLDAGFRQDQSEHAAPAERTTGASNSTFGMNMLPVGCDRNRATSPLFNYPYAKAREALHGLTRDTADDPHFGFRLRYANPVNGDWAIATIATWMQLLPKGFKTQNYRSTDGTVFVVAEGAGRSIVGGQSIDWTKGDIFVVPSWSMASHEASEEAVLFGASDRVVQEKLGLWREHRQIPIDEHLAYS
ncbi:gentisate 1,2-dioxygenase [Sphingobium sp. JS3065]|uniref:gentisate 1,2-dioxygenase n=1 Tax=Sphingobium sp. JS3065 TaxID=2970925 RepID=UPI002263B93D|nr:gentisate 1,2-dioxygenase [Sphingobium sp. JS3065]UZW57467.1 gentisate 1,2-dioxygenase [Sphingobium sp. JS3065]